MLRPIMLLALFLTVLPCGAQQGIDYQIRQYTGDDGLPSNGIKGLQWDERTGFLWIATEAGVVRFNGVAFKTFTSDDDPSISNQRISYLARDRRGNLLAADFGGQLFRVEDHRVVHVPLPSSKYARSNLPFARISDAFLRRSILPDLAQLPLGPRFLAVSDTAVYFISGSRFLYWPVSSAAPEDRSEGSSWSVCFRIGNRAFVADSLRRVFRLDETNGNRFPVPVADAPDTRLPGQVIWEEGMQRPVVLQGNLAWVLRDSAGRLWRELICTELPPNLIVRFAQYDQSRQTLALGTESKGIVLIRPYKLKSVQAKELKGDVRSSYYAQVALPGPAVITNEGTVLGAGPATAPPALQRPFGVSVFRRGDSILYFSQVQPGEPDGRLCKHDFRSGKTTVYRNIIMGEHCLMEECDGRLLVLMLNGIFELVDDTLVPVYRFPEVSTPRTFYDFRLIRPGVIAIAGCNALAQFNLRNGRLDTLFQTAGYCVRTIWPVKGRVFFGTYGGGLFVYNNGEARPLPLDKRKYLAYTHCFVDDQRGNCWISTNKGLFVIPLERLLAVADGRETVPLYSYLGKNDGMRMTELNGGCKPCALTLPGGVISFPSMDGLLWVDPEKASPDIPSGKIYFDELLADSLRIRAASGQVSELPAGTQDVVCRFVFPAWCNSENLYVEYQLDPDKPWHPVAVGSEPIELRFNNPGSGYFPLRVRFRSGFGDAAYTYGELPFRIRAHWYESKWLLIVCAIVLGLIIWGLHLLRTRQLRLNQQRLERAVEQKTYQLRDKAEALEKSDRLKTRLISIISHDIVTPLKFLNATSRNLVEQRPSMNEALQQETLEEIMQTSQELQHLSTNILNWIRYQQEHRRLPKEHFSLYQVVDQVLRVFQAAARAKGVLLVNDVEETLSLYGYREPLQILVHNLVSNAINFSEGGMVAVGCTPDREGCRLTVSDQGAGMTEEQVRHVLSGQYIISSIDSDERKGSGLGYLIVRETAGLLGAKLHIESEPGRGTTVFVSLPAGDQS